MIAAGCLSLVVLPLAGLTLGTLIAGSEGAIWGAILGLAVAGGACGITAYALVKAGRRG